MRKLLAILILLLAGCGSGASDPPAQAITGTAQVGASKSATVFLKDSTGTQFITTTDANGHFSFDTQRLGVKAPSMLKAVFSNSSTAYGLAQSGNSLVSLDQANTIILTLANTWTTLAVAYVNFSMQFFWFMFNNVYQFINLLPQP
ncbi:transthyretin-like family protein [Citrifermentans bremense]|uniref:hypothetical protein n=1 Tax=Citrifermentans bremense TaxID=60035 RepID=UPI00047AE9EB|nr:hypothetical protein [Citrifermentans bremense]